ncbi:MAG TPA: 1,4-alpha-glucan branching protein domain-containing protein, partial [Verrucomicrobiae bacterium]|nr:1,4-alpha-glucan branching protein domain-containing protein [Verrucomicrobiae bacterium]
ARLGQIKRLAEILDRPPLIVSPYDAELFGHWWYEGPEFLDYFVRKSFYDQKTIKLITPTEYLHLQPTNQIATPGASSWGEEGYWRTWLNETNQWIYPHLQIAQERMTQLARRFQRPSALNERALKQAGRELLLAQASDWPFILRTGTSSDYARRRVKDHLLRFIALYEQLTKARVDEPWLVEIERRDNIFPDLNFRYWA